MQYPVHGGGQGGGGRSRSGRGQGQNGYRMQVTAGGGRVDYNNPGATQHLPGQGTDANALRRAAHSLHPCGISVQSTITTCAPIFQHCEGMRQPKCLLHTWI